MTQQPDTIPIPAICPRCHEPRPHICYGAHMSGPPVVPVTRQRPGALLAVETPKAKRIDD